MTTSNRGLFLEVEKGPNLHPLWPGYHILWKKQNAKF